jgi:hypothetical protein
VEAEPDDEADPAEPDPERRAQLRDDAVRQDADLRSAGDHAEHDEREAGGDDLGDPEDPLELLHRGVGREVGERHHGEEAEDDLDDHLGPPVRGDGRGAPIGGGLLPVDDRRDRRIRLRGRELREPRGPLAWPPARRRAG